MHIERDQVYKARGDVNTSQLSVPPTCDGEQIHFYLTTEEMKVHWAILLRGAARWDSFQK